MSAGRARTGSDGETQGATPRADARLRALRECLDQPAGRYQALRGTGDLAAYLDRPSDRADEELLTEPVLAAIIERVLGFPTGAYFPQLGRGGSKPDFTPIDLVAHPFVLDAKGSDQPLGAHEPQIRRYVDERRLDYGILFNLRELRVYRRGGRGHDPTLSFGLLPLWRLARGEALPGPEARAFAAFAERFGHREMDLAARVEHIRRQDSWALRSRRGEAATVDVEFLAERLRALAGRLVDDATAQMDVLDGFLALGSGRERALRRELELLALDIAPGTDLNRLPVTIAGWRAGDGLVGRAWRQYLLRVAYLALTRILLYRAWEDVEFVESHLHDGGFDVAYERMRGDVRAVLDTAYRDGAERYPWLYGHAGNYDWYRPRDDALVEVLYALAPVPLGRLDADVLGDLYASYVDAIDRDRLGQFYTPRAVVRFMLDRAGFSGPEGVFRIAGDTRRPRRVFDFATGSGGFLVEAARRVIDEGGIADDDVRGLSEALSAVVTGLVGGEISPFPYYLTEVNLLLQVSRLLGRLRLAGQRPGGFTLGALHVDSLLARDPGAASIPGLAPGLRADRGGLVADERFGLVPLDGDKRETFRALREEGGFDLVIGNPPYVAEANNRALFERLRAIPAWRGTYRGKTDYLYYFLLLAAEKVAPGGRLCVITPAGWMNAGAAGFLRERLAGVLRLDELFLFGAYRLFTPVLHTGTGPVPAPTVESAILVATRTRARANHRLSVIALEDQEEAARALSGDSAARVPERGALLAEMARRVRGRPGRRRGIHVHRVAQAGLVADRPWPVKHGAGDVPSRVVAHLQALLDDEAAPVEPLQRGWRVLQGIQTGADAYTRRIRRRLTPAQVEELEAAGGRIGDPILELPPGAEREPPWRDHPELLARSPEPRALLYGALDDADYTSLVVLGNAEPPSAVLDRLRQWRAVLETRADIVANRGRKPWWAVHRGRSPELMGAPKAIALYRTDRGRFALDEQGDWRPSVKATLAVGRMDDAPVAYLCGLLNSELLDLWYAVRGKAPRDVWRNYEPLRMNEMPYRRPEGGPRAGELAALVRRIAANRRALLPHRAVFPELVRLVKDPWKTDAVDVDPRSAVAALPAAETVSVRLDGRLEPTLGPPPHGRPRRVDARTLAFRRGRAETGRVTGEPRLIDLLVASLGPARDADPAAVLLPKDLGAFEAGVAARRREVGALLAEGRRLVEEAERCVCALYDIPADLTEEVVAHAVRRASSAPVGEAL